MPRAWQYSASRRLAMQVVMCLLLAASLGAAALVGRFKQRPNVVLGQAMQQWQLKWQYPSGWRIDRERSIFPPLATVRAREPVTGEEMPRELSLTQQPVMAGTTPQEVLSRFVPGNWSGEAGEPFKIGQYAGQKWSLHGINADREVVYILCGCAVVNNTAISVRLEGPGVATPADQQLFEKVAASIQIVPAK